MAVFGLWYGLQRLLLDYTRGLDERPLLGLTGTQLLAIVVIVSCIAVLAVIARQGHGIGEDHNAAPSPRSTLLRTPPPAQTIKGT